MEKLVEDEYHLLIASSKHKVIQEKYDDLLDMHDHVSVILKFPPKKGEDLCVCISFTIESFATV